MTDLVYALLQIIHNFGAAAVVSGPFVAYWSGFENPLIKRRLTLLIIIGAFAQITSGLGFGAASYLLKGELPEVEGIAFLALMTKVICVIAILIIMLYLLKDKTYYPAKLWLATAMLSSFALSAAAFLRWYL